MAYGKVDLQFSADGDLVLDQGGSIVDTALYPLQSLKQEVITRLLTNVGDWKQHPWMGTNSKQYIGEPLNEETVEALIVSITHGLTTDGLVNKNDLTIEWAKWDATTIVMVITINVGSLDPDGQGRLEIPFTFDFEDLGITIFDK